MSGPPQGPGPVERTSQGLEAWLDGNDSATFDAQDAYIAEHTWKYVDETQTIEPFGESAAGNVAQESLSMFLGRKQGAWKVEAEDRKAKWSESAPLCQLICS